MSEDFCFEIWAEHLHADQDFSTEEKCDRFLNLLEDAQKNMSYDVAVEILRTFSDADDFEIQEHSRIILESIDKNIFYPALIQELDGIIKRSPQKEWATTLVGIEFDYGNPDDLMRVVQKSPEKSRAVFYEFVASQGFLSEYPSALKYISQQ